MTRRALGAAILALALSAAGGCNCSESGQGDAAVERELVVFAASSLQDVFTALSASFREKHPGVEVKFSFAGTQQLRTQIEHGASFDVFAAADSVHALTLVHSNHLRPSSTIAENEPVIVVAPSASALVRQLADLPHVDRLVIGSREVPIGRYTLEVLERATRELGHDFRRQVESKVVSRELNVRQVLSKVLLGEAQAGVVYRSDALTAKGRVTLVEIPRRLNVVARYPIAVAVKAPHPGLARAWVDFMRSAEARAALSAAGFRVPEGGDGR
jgi:molybdate transport system substrate-binding protein